MVDDVGGLPTPMVRSRRARSTVCGLYATHVKSPSSAILSHKVLPHTNAHIPGVRFRKKGSAISQRQGIPLSMCISFISMTSLVGSRRKIIFFLLFFLFFFEDLFEYFNNISVIRFLVPKRDTYGINILTNIVEIVVSLIQKHD